MYNALERLIIKIRIWRTIHPSILHKIKSALQYLHHGNKAYTRKKFLEILPQHSIGAEIGVLKGDFTKHILEVVKPSKLHLVDGWWKLYGEFYPDWGIHTDWGRLKTKDAFGRAVNQVNKSGRKESVVFHVEDDLVCLSGFPDRYFDWIYIDTTHEYEHTKKELEISKNKVKERGLITGHDWNPDPAHPFHGVSRAVREFCLTHNWQVIMVDSCGQWAISRNGRISFS